MVKGKAREVRAPLASPECWQVGTCVCEPRVTRAPASPLLPAHLALVSTMLLRAVHDAVNAPGPVGAGVGVSALAAGACAWDARALSSGPVCHRVPAL